MTDFLVSSFSGEFLQAPGVLGEANIRGLAVDTTNGLVHFHWWISSRPPGWVGAK
ncbi:hypothetical protein NHX12_026276, partial [Muraenolepis orangiensis]